MRLEFVGTFKSYLLMDEILSAIPELMVVEGLDPFGRPSNKCLLSIGGTENGIAIEFPDELDPSRIQTVVDAHNPTNLSFGEKETEFLNDAIAIYKNLPPWAKDFTVNDAVSFIHQAIFSGHDEVWVNNYIDTTVTSVATARIALKSIAKAVLEQRTIMEEQTKLLLAIRDILLLQKK